MSISTTARVVNLDRRKLITLSAHICLQHVGRDSEHCAVRLQQMRILLFSLQTDALELDGDNSLVFEVIE